MGVDGRAGESPTARTVRFRTSPIHVLAYVSDWTLLMTLDEQVERFSTPPKKREIIMSTNGKSQALRPQSQPPRSRVSG
jgi:hypothetical protein